MSTKIECKKNVYRSLLAYWLTSSKASQPPGFPASWPLSRQVKVQSRSQPQPQPGAISAIPPSFPAFISPRISIVGYQYAHAY
jgi:hypothetical protein